MTFDEHQAGLDAAVDGAFMEPDLYMRNYFRENLMRFKWMRAALFQGLPLKGPAHDNQ